MSDVTASGPVIVERGEAEVVSIIMDRPRFNLLDLEMLGALRNGFDEALASGARAIVLSGSNDCFCAGLDTKALMSYGAEQQQRVVEDLNGFVRDLYGAPVPTVAAVSGHALAGGMIFALACDRRFVASGESRLGLPEVQAGVPYPAVPLLVARAEAPPQVLRSLALTGRSESPDALVDARVFDAAVPSRELLTAAREEAALLAEHPAYGRIKDQLRGDVCAAADRIIETKSDPMLSGWV